MTAPAPPAPFDALWHAQAFALAVALNEAGLYSWSDWTERFGADLQAARAQDPLDGSDDYFTVWLTTLEAMLRSADPALLSALPDWTRAWTEAYLTTPHGQPVRPTAP